MGLLSLLKHNKNVRKIFGKKEIEIIFKQLEGAQLTQSEKNRLSRDIRPKLEFIKQANEFRDEFRLERNQSNKKIIEKALAAILNDKIKENVLAVLLFGSYSDKTATKRSDIDVCAVLKKNISLKEATLFRMRIAREVPEKIDIQVFNALPQVLKRSIARNHKILYKRNEYDNVGFSLKYLKDKDYFIRKERIFGAEA